MTGPPADWENSLHNRSCTALTQIGQQSASDAALFA